MQTRYSGSALIYCISILRIVMDRSSLVAQWVKDLALSLLWLESLLWRRFWSWPRNFHMLRAQPKKKKKKKKNCDGWTLRASPWLLLSWCSHSTHASSGVWVEPVTCCRPIEGGERCSWWHVGDFNVSQHPPCWSLLLLAAFEELGCWYCEPMQQAS